MVVDAITNGIVLDHIRAGLGMILYKILGLNKLTCSVALLNNVKSNSMGKKDIIKFDEIIDLDFDVLGYMDPDITVVIVKDGKVIKKFKTSLPERITNVIFCKNPRCITTTEQELPHIFKLTDPEKRVYRCIYCESKAKTTDESLYHL